MVIYQIRSKINNKVYIGSAIKWSDRRAKHLRDLRGNKHHSKHLQNHYNKYGESDLIFEVLEEVSNCNLLEREQYWLDKVRPFEKTRGFNICKDARSRKGLKSSEATKRRISVAKKGQGVGRKRSVETREKIAKSVSGKRNWNYGRDSELNVSAKLNWLLVDKMRDLYKSGNYSYKDLTEVFDISKSQVARVINRQSWS